MIYQLCQCSLDVLCKFVNTKKTGFTPDHPHFKRPSLKNFQITSWSIWLNPEALLGHVQILMALPPLQWLRYYSARPEGVTTSHLHLFRKSGTTDHIAAKDSYNIRQKIEKLDKMLC